jgi:hypothetical protein
MKTFEFSIFGLIKQTSKGPHGTEPLLLRVRQTYSEGLVRRMSLHYKHMLSSSNLCENKEVLAINGGGKNWERIVSKLVFHEKVTFEHDTLSLALCLGWKIHLYFDHTPIRLQIGL